MTTSTNLRFVDVTQQAGIDYKWVVEGQRPLNILQSIGNGCAFLDYDNDGNLDLLLVGPKVALYHGDGHGHFTDVSQKMGLDSLHGNFLGCAVGDYDNDGFDDVYLSAYRGGALLHNAGGKRFDNVSVQAGVKPQPWGTSCAFADIDGSGRLSLYVGNYVDFGPNTKPQMCNFSGTMMGCAPTYYAPIRGVLYRNSGDGKFTEDAQTIDESKTSGRVLGVAFADFDGSGRQSLYLANDQTVGNLLQHSAKGFVDIGVTSGVGVDADGTAQNGMGVDWGDYDNDGRLDLVVGTFRHQSKPIYHNDGNGVFTNQSASLGLDHATFPYVAFGIKWLDADNDGYLDVMLTNGHVQDNTDRLDSTSSYREPTQVFRNDDGRQFSDASAGLTGTAVRPIVGRGLAIGDYDNDGRVDALVVDSEGTPLLLHNETPAAGHWLEIKLAGKEDNRDGQGALIAVKAGGMSLLRRCSTDGSYMSASSKIVHIGLGNATTADSITVRWPSGHVDKVTDVRADQIIDLAEGKPMIH